MGVGVGAGVKALDEALDCEVEPLASKQISMFEQQEAKFKKDLDEMDVNSMTPIQALQKLDELKKKHGL